MKEQRIKMEKVLLKKKESLQFVNFVKSENCHGSVSTDPVPYKYLFQGSVPVSIRLETLCQSCNGNRGIDIE